MWNRLPFLVPACLLNSNILYIQAAWVRVRLSSRRREEECFLLLEIPQDTPSTLPCFPHVLFWQKNRAITHAVMRARTQTSGSRLPQAQLSSVPVTLSVFGGWVLLSREERHTSSDQRQHWRSQGGLMAESFGSGAVVISPNYKVNMVKSDCSVNYCCESIYKCALECCGQRKSIVLQSFSRISIKRPEFGETLITASCVLSDNAALDPLRAHTGLSYVLFM